MNSTSTTSTSSQTWNLAIWTAFWLATTAFATFAPKLLWTNNSVLTILSISLNFGVGLLLIRANFTYWKTLDEMMQRVHLNAMGIALGLTMISGLSVSLLKTNAFISGNVDFSLLLVIMSLTYLTSVGIGMRKLK